MVECQASQSSLWINLKKWVSGSFGSYKHTVDLEDKESGTLIIKFDSSSSLGDFLKLIISSTVKVDVRENKYRYTISEAKYKIDHGSRLSGNLNCLTTDELNKAESELTAAMNISLTPNIDDDFKRRIDIKEKDFTDIPEYLSEKDQKKNRVNPRYIKSKTELELLKSIDDRYTSLLNSLSKSLKSNMNIKDDF